MSTRIIIYGAGAIGSVLGGHLFRHGYAVTLLGNAEHMKAVKSHGLKLVTAKETYVLPIPVAESASELIPFHKDDLVLLCVKSQHTLKCLGQLKNAGAPNTIPVFCCQNSIWNESIATRVFNRIYGVMLFVDAIFLSPGEVINPITGRFGFIEIGCYPYGSDALCKEIARFLRSSGFSTIVNEHVMKSKGAKCLLNLSNALHAITNGKGDLNQFERELRREAIRVWSLAGIEYEDLRIFKKRCREYSGKLEMPKGYKNLSREASVSSWQSLARRTGNIESEQLNGDVVTLGRLLGIETPYNHLVWHIADRMARKKEKPGKYTADELARMIRTSKLGKCGV